jgi:rhodanese-related sulfurtransferase
MDGNATPITHDDLYARLGTAAAPMLIDVRKTEAFNADDRLIVGASHRAPQDVARWQGALPAGRQVVAYCVHGHERTGRTRNCRRAASATPPKTNGSPASIRRSTGSLVPG